MKNYYEDTENIKAIPSKCVVINQGFGVSKDLDIFDFPKCCC